MNCLGNRFLGQSFPIVAVLSAAVAAFSLFPANLRASSVDQVFAVALRAFDQGDMETAKELFEACSEMGDSGASNNLAVIEYSQSATFTPKTLAALEGAAATGLTSAHFNLAQYYRKQGVLDRAKTFYKKPADEGNLAASINLAILIVESSHADSVATKDALTVLENYALRGHVLAQYAMGVSVEKGTFGQILPDAAMYWYREAASRDFEPAKQRIEILSSRAGEAGPALPPPEGPMLPPAGAPLAYAFDESWIMERRLQTERISTAEKLDEAWELSIFDAMSEEKRAVYEDFTESEVSGYLGLRYSHSLTGSADPLAQNMQSIGTIIELRSGFFSGLRLYGDFFPKASTEVDDETHHTSWSRILLGWAFEIDSPWLVDKFHITPKFGSYSLDASLPGSKSSDPVDIAMALEPAFGLEADFEISRFWYMVRGSFAADIPVLSQSQIEERGGKVQATRFGLDLFLKGSGLSFGFDQTSLSYLIFVAREQIKVTTMGDIDETFQLDLPLGGLGLTLSW